jgi:hypothetical protein
MTPCSSSSEYLASPRGIGEAPSNDLTAFQHLATLDLKTYRNSQGQVYNRPSRVTCTTIPSINSPTYPVLLEYPI